MYWFEVSPSVTRTTENVTTTTVIVEPAIVDNVPRAPAALAPRGAATGAAIERSGVHSNQKNCNGDAAGYNQREQKLRAGTARL